ncbi:hypothetical protein QWY86_17380 [Pedobacter aquatilis]|nr:hypothetical protein [Pedobacter aquatilis]
MIYRRGIGHPLLMRLPYKEGNRSWLKHYGRINPQWIVTKKHWELPQAWFNDLVSRSLTRFGKLYIIQPYREQEKCAPACWNAQGHECQCSCMGANHGSQSEGNGWFVVSDTFATRWNSIELACRLLVKKYTLL